MYLESQHMLLVILQLSHKTHDRCIQLVLTGQHCIKTLSVFIPFQISSTLRNRADSTASSLPGPMKVPYCSQQPLWRKPERVLLTSRHRYILCLTVTIRSSPFIGSIIPRQNFYLSTRRNLGQELATPVVRSGIVSMSKRWSARATKVRISLAARYRPG